MRFNIVWIKIKLFKYSVTEKDGIKNMQIRITMTQDIKLWYKQCMPLFILFSIGIALGLAAQGLHTASLNAFKEKNLSVHDSAVITGLDAFSQFILVFSSWIAIFSMLFMIINWFVISSSDSTSKNEAFHTSKEEDHQCQAE